MIEFIPNRTIEPSTSTQSIKGRRPTVRYDTSIFDIYASCFVLTGYDLYAAVRKEMNALDETLQRLVGHGPSGALPLLTPDDDPTAIIWQVFTPARFATSSRAPLAYLRELGPFPMSQASGLKLGHSFGWVDSNIKLSVEDMLSLLERDLRHAPKIAYSLIRIYSLLLRANDFELARSITFNVSMFIQERLLDLCFGHLYGLMRRSRDIRSMVASEAALQFLQEVHESDLSLLLQLSVFVGIVWPTISAQIAQGELDAQGAIVELDARVRAQRLWGINESRRVLDYLGSVQGTVVVMLDDDAESIVDLLVMQNIMQNPGLRLSIVVNRIPISNNISYGAVDAALKHDLFKPLRRCRDDGRLEIMSESQLFPSLEYPWLSARARAEIDKSCAVFLKGINYFETFGQSGLRRIYSFAVGSPTTSLLTGLPEGHGVVMLAEPHEVGFVYEDEFHIRTVIENKLGAAS
jgi:hypothetical protein